MGFARIFKELNRSSITQQPPALTGVCACRMKTFEEEAEAPGITKKKRG